MNRFEPTLEHAFYAIALAFAISLRFFHLGALPLSNFEADWALQALRIIQGLRPTIGPNPAYVHLTAVLFFLFSATNFLARFWPALAGTALVLAPWLLRRRMGRIPALVLAFGLALDPGLVAMSRLAGGPILAGWPPYPGCSFRRGGFAVRAFGLVGSVRAGVDLGIYFGFQVGSLCACGRRCYSE
jgi:predicted membrane-bound mannosyltransferase